MASSRPSGSKRKLEWTGAEDSFAHPKKPRVIKQGETPFGSALEFPRSTFGQRSPAMTSKGKGPAFSLHSQMSDFALHTHQDRSLFQTPRRETKHEVRLTTPKPPGQPRPPLHADSRPPSSSKKLVSLAEIPFPILQPAFEPESSTPKGMKSAFRTPLIPGAFVSPPTSQELKVPLSEILGEMSPKRLSSREIELNRGLAPSPVKGGHSPKKTFIRGGLADRAKLFMTRSTTDYSLWYQDVSSSGGGLEPSLRIRVKEVVCRNPSHESPLLSQSHAQSTTNLSSILVRCEHVDKPRGDRTEVLVLLTTSSSRGSVSAEGARRRVADVSGVAVGREVLLWKPWTEIQVPSRIENGPTNSLLTALLCSRFVVK